MIRSTSHGQRKSILTALLFALAACTEPLPTAPAGEGSAAAEELLAAGHIKSWLRRFRKNVREPNAAVYWNRVAREFVVANGSPAPVAIRGYAIIGVAQYNAAIAAEKAKLGKVRPSTRAAIGAASVAALAYLYPDQESNLEALLDAFLAAPAGWREKHKDIEAGKNIGRSTGNEVVAHAETDNFFAPGTVEVPVGPCLWFSDSPPVGPLWSQARTYLLRSSDQFRPPPPPACDSEAFASGLAEVRQISDTRTPEQAANAQFWDFPAGTYTPPGYWNEEAARLVTKYHLDDRRAARVFAFLHMVGYDGLVASHEGKYFYWLIRPSQADPQITTAIPLPNFPSYPANHAVVSGGMARMLGHLFPAERRRLDALAEEAAFSRVLGGIHYRFDGEAGLTLGRRIAAWARAHAVRRRPIMLR